MIVDIILVLVLIYIISTILYNQKKDNDTNEFNILSNNIIFDDDIILVDKSCNKKEQFENKINNTPVNTSVNTSVKEIKNENINININEIFDLPDNTLDKHIEQNKMTNENKKNIELLFLPNNESRLNNRYNRKYNNIPSEQELYNIRKYNLKQNIDLSNEDDIKSNMINNLKTIYSKNNKNIDTKIFNKNNKSQKLFKDAKTIAGRFSKNSIIDDYKYELDYYEKLRTPWWSENVN